MQHDAAFRALVNRLNVTPVEELPRLAGFLASSLAGCSLERYFTDARTNASPVIAHKLKTRISALLQGRSQAGRLSAVILIKTIIESAGSNLLASSEPWARGLLSCLGKAEPPEIKKLYLTTITRIFVLTQHQPALIREITTPLLPSFLTTCLSLIRPIVARSGDQSVSVPSPLLDTVLQCWLHLLPQHASIFRPFLNRIKPICLSFIEDHRSPKCTLEFSIRVLCSLISCAPKNTAGQEWSQMSSSVIGLAHGTASDVFRAILEDHESNNPSLIASAKKHNFAKPQETSGKDQLGLAAWKGVSEGSSRLATLLSWLRHLLSSGTTQQVQVPFGEVLDLTTRILSVNVPESQSGPGHNLRYHIEASKEERDELLLNLPRLNISCLALLWSLCTTHDGSLLPLYRVMCDQVLFKSQTMSWHQEIRVLCYDIIRHLGSTSNLYELDIHRKALSSLIAQVFDDLKAALSNADSNKPGENFKELTLVTKTIQRTDIYSVQRLLDKPSSTFGSAWKLLPVLLGSGAAPLLSRQARTEADRLAILLNHREAMLASVLNPVFSEDGYIATASVLPFLTRSAAGTTAVEALLRPRFPPAQTQVTQPEDSDLHITIDGPPLHNAEGGDILSQLENSLNEMDKDSEYAGDAADSTNNMSYDVREPIEPRLLPKKRPFDDQKENESLVAVKHQIESEMRLPKRPRPDEVVDALPASVEYEVETTSTVPGFPDTKNVQDNASPHEQSLGSMVSRPTGNEAPSILDKGDSYDSDSSDFEIPKIDTGFDTDEEDDEEEEGQNEEITR
ncbi:uncharacterized protein A1O9_02125 [Exophiala aquamarina CBS 119918]|uniref:Pre-rRNA-processing protein RIX1 n=1 Tax=Exophiala aquamarina CBS 119918 TaxID=1182545 RepID=A0A072PKB7_9EURO|nr:uncharacterized protein A1O9_02125 [Exophiala aquamarina CBS 119918]KEF60564.1 hypothetical protein A1O9_02125 [Exophiala aquamarina CBS 119918]